MGCGAYVPDPLRKPAADGVAAATFPQESMKATIVRPGELGASEIAAWRAMQRSSPDLLNPFLSPASRYQWLG